MNERRQDGTHAAMSGASAWIGRIVDGRYRIERVLGEGGMGAVFAAEHLTLRKPVALKIILPHLAGDPEHAQRFAREAMASANLEHPHVANALDYGQLEGGGAYLVMQLARGVSLRAWMRGRADWRAAAEIGAQIADALGAAHARGIVHRDLKPENVMIEEREGTLHARVLDFGISRVTDLPKDGAQLTRVGTIIGTPGYMAPEQAVGEAVDARADVYALGVILWELSCGRRLFGDSDLGQIVAAQLTGTAPRPSAFVADVAPAFDDLVGKLLASSRRNRPANGTEVRDALRAITALGRSSSSVAAVPTPSPASAGALPSMLTVASELGTEITPPIAAPAPHASARLAPIVAGVGTLLVVIFSCVLSRTACGAETVAPTSSPFAAAPDATGLGSALEGVPGVLAGDAALLLSSPDDATRAAAAARLAPHHAHLPAVVRMILALETSEGCEERRDAIRALRVLRDPRALPTVARIASVERRADRCLRRELERTIAALGDVD